MPKVHKEYKKVIEKFVSDGDFRFVVMNTGKHQNGMLHIPSGSVIRFSKTPSDFHGADNFRRQLCRVRNNYYQ